MVPEVNLLYIIRTNWHPNLSSREDSRLQRAHHHQLLSSFVKVGRNNQGYHLRLDISSDGAQVNILDDVVKPFGKAQPLAN